MRIQQAEILAGISKKSIRYYEEEGLLTPKRNQNSYRDYSEDDVRTLQKIKLLRKLGVSLEEIRLLQSGSVTLPQILVLREEKIHKEEKDLSEIRYICRKMAEQPKILADLDPNPYLKEMAELEKGGVRFMNVQNDKKKQKKGSILAAFVVLAACFAFTALTIWGELHDPLPWELFVIILLLPIGCAIGVLLALRTRIQEIEKGEQDESIYY